MPKPTPFHPRTQPQCVTYAWKLWAGYYTVCTYDISPEREYNAIRQGTALIDVTPLFKYDVIGPDAGVFLSYVLARSVERLKVGRMVYCCWCDDAGRILDDGTCARLTDEHYRLTAAEPSYHWLARHAEGFDVRLEDISSEMAALALQGPTSRNVLKQVCDVDMDKFRFFGIAETKIGDTDVVLSRTGYTGDLGYEVWVKNADALAVYDLIHQEGKRFGAVPVGLDAMDIARIEAGFVMAGVDYTGANHCLVESQMSTPLELGLGWTVKFKNHEPFIGRAALLAEKEAGSKWAFVGLDIDWDAVEALFAEYGLPPRVPSAAWRGAVPIYRGRRQVGRATSGSWSPMLKKNVALATIEAAYAEPGTILQFEMTVEWERRKVPATVCKLPFFNPERKRS